MLHALEHHLMDEEAVRIFCEEYTAERNRLQARAEAGRADLEKELRNVTTSHKKLANAILAGIPAEEVKEQMLDLSARRKELDRLLATAPGPAPLRLPPVWAEPTVPGSPTLLTT